MTQPVIVPTDNETDDLGTAAKRWLTIFAKRFSNGVDDYLISELRDALKIKGKTVNDAAIADGYRLAYKASDQTIIYVPASSLETDNQIVSQSASTTTTSTSFIDLPGMTLTTTGTVTKNYAIDFNGECNNTNNGKIVWVIVNIDGVDIVGSEMECAVNNAPKANPTLTSWSADIAPGKIIKIRWKTDANTAGFDHRRLRIRGAALK